MIQRLSNYKKSIDLVKFMKQIQYGFSEPKNSTSEKPILERVEGHVPKKETYTIQKNSKNEFIYWSTKDNNLKGKNIVDFVIDNHNKDFKNEIKLEDVDQLLEPISKNQDFTANLVSQIGVSKENNLTIAKQLCDLIKLDDRRELYNKGLSDKTIDHPLFNKIMYNIPGTDPLGVGYISINEEEVQAINIYANENGKDIDKSVGNTQNSIMCTSITKEPPIDSLVIAETMDEAMAHYESDYNNIQSQNVRYIATGKEPSLEQLRLIQKNIDELNPSTLIIATSNSLKGEFTQNKILSKLNISPDGKMLNPSSLNFRGFIDVEETSQLGLINITLPKDVPNFQENMDKLLASIEKKQKTFNNLHQQGEPFTISIDTEGKKDAIVHLKFDNSKMNWKISADLINEVKFDNHPFIRRDVSIQENFNKDLISDKIDKLENNNNNDLNKDLDNDNDKPKGLNM